MSKKNHIESFASGLREITEIDRLFVFFGTIIIIAAIIWQRPYSVSIILYCLSGISFTFFLKFFKKTTRTVTEDDSGRVHTKEVSEYEFFRQNINKIWALPVASLVLFVLATIFLW